MVLAMRVMFWMNRRMVTESVELVLGIQNQVEVNGIKFFNHFLSSKQ